MTSPTMEASQHVYVVKVRALPDPGLLFPSERRYSSLTVAGLAAGHALLGCVALLLGALALSWDPPQGSWFGHLGAGLWLGAAALQAAVCGALAWRRWYEDHYIVWFFRASLLAAAVAAVGLVLTSAALVHLHENVLSVRPIHPADLPPHVAVYEPEHEHGVSSDAALADEGSGGGPNPSWLDISDLPLPDANSSTISSGGVFSDLVRDQDHDLVAADSTRHEDREAVGPGDAHSGEPEWSVLRWVPVPLPPRASAQIRSLLAANVLVACALELLWALLGARLAWRGMRATDGDLAEAAAPAEHHRHAVAAAAVTAPLATLAALERGAADGKVDVDTDNSVISDGELKKSGKKVIADGDKMKTSTRRKQQQQEHAKKAASLQRRRRAPQLPELHLSLEQRTMNLEERVARLLAPGHCERDGEHDGEQQNELQPEQQLEQQGDKLPDQRSEAGDGQSQPSP